MRRGMGAPRQFRGRWAETWFSINQHTVHFPMYHDARLPIAALSQRGCRFQPWLMHTRNK